MSLAGSWWCLVTYLVAEWGVTLRAVVMLLILFGGIAVIVEVTFGHGGAVALVCAAIAGLIRLSAAQRKSRRR
jgi:hypothetical protein